MYDSSIDIIPDGEALRVAERSRCLAYGERAGDPELAAFAIRLADNIGYACDDKPAVKLYLSQVVDIMGWPATAASRARVSRLWNRLARMGVLDKQLDRSECPRDERGNYLSYQGTCNWVRFRGELAPGAREPLPPEPEPKPAKHVAVPGVQCPQCGGPCAVLSYKCLAFGCGRDFPAQRPPRRPVRRLSVVPPPSAYAAPEPSVPAALPVGSEAPPLLSSPNAKRSDVPAPIKLQARHEPWETADPAFWTYLCAQVLAYAKARNAGTHRPGALLCCPCGAPLLMTSGTHGVRCVCEGCGKRRIVPFDSPPSGVFPAPDGGTSGGPGP